MSIRFGFSERAAWANADRRLSRAVFAKASAAMEVARKLRRLMSLMNDLPGRAASVPEVAELLRADCVSFYSHSALIGHNPPPPRAARPPFSCINLRVDHPPATRRSCAHNRDGALHIPRPDGAAHRPSLVRSGVRHRR